MTEKVNMLTDTAAMSAALGLRLARLRRGPLIAALYPVAVLLCQLLLAGLAIGARAVRQLATGDADGMDRMLMARTYIDEAAETLEAVADAQQGMDTPPANARRAAA